MIFPSPKTLFCIYPSKENLSKNLTLQKVFQNCNLALSGRPHGRPLAEQNCSVGRSGGRPTCTNVYCAHRSTVLVDRQKEQSSLFVPVDRQRVVTICLGLRSTARSTAFPTVKNLTVGGRPPGRPTVEKSAELAPTTSFSFVFCWVFSQRIY